jgi:hypothetical protein
MHTVDYYGRYDPTSIKELEEYSASGREGGGKSQNGACGLLRYINIKEIF